jgi:signal transduction histidine kinase
LEILVAEVGVNELLESLGEETMNKQSEILDQELEIIRVLLIEDDSGETQLICDMLSGADGVTFEPECVSWLSMGLERLATGAINVILLDLGLPDSQGLDTFTKVYARVPKVPIVVLTCLDDVTLAIKAVRGGAQDYLVKSQVDSKLLIRSLHYAIERKRAEDKLSLSYERLRNLARHLQSIREEERTCIAREIHDELGQALTALKMDMSWLSNRLAEDKRLLFEKTKSMLNLIDVTLKAVKRISTELRPGLLDDLGLAAAIEWQAEEFQNRTGCKCELTIDPKDIVLDDDRSTAIFRIFQEALTNVARHADATMVKASLIEKADKLELRVEDNGCGITLEQISDPRSFGLIGIRERVHPWGGEVKIKGVRNSGTTVTVTVPLNR